MKCRLANNDESYFYAITTKDIYEDFFFLDIKNDGRYTFCPDNITIKNANVICN